MRFLLFYAVRNDRVFLFYGNKIHYQIDILPKDVLNKLVPVKIGGLHDHSRLIRWQNQQFSAVEFVY